MRKYLITIAAFILSVLLITPAYAKEATWCEFGGLAGMVFEWAPQAISVAKALGVETDSLGAFLESDLGNFLGGLRTVAMTEDQEQVVDYLAQNGLAAYASTLDADDWQKLWTWCDAVAPAATSIFIRRGDDGNLEGWAVSVAIYVYKRGDIDELSVGAFLSALPTLRFTPEEEQVGIEWLMQHIAIAVNLARQ